MRPTRPLLFSLALLAGIVPAVANAQVVTLTTGDRQVRIAVDEAATLPADFPADIALPGQYTLARVERSGNDTMLALDLPGGIDSAAAELAARMRADGWREARTVPPATGRAQAWEKDERAVIAWLAPAPAGTRLELRLLPRR